MTGLLNIHVPSGVLRINSVTGGSSRRVRRTIWLDNTVLPDVIIGEASAGFVDTPRRG